VLPASHDGGMRAVLRDVNWDPDPSALPADPAQFTFNARLMVGPSDGAGAESFDVTVCSPEWLARRCQTLGFFDGLHHVVVDVSSFDQRALRTWLEVRVNAVEADDWTTLAGRLSRLGWWEFEGYRD